ncbi:MAG: inositol monophosphatase family protein, partial [Pseudomonadota bacterium]|nr:inositol monophosphatase family protein [Pseudomonadota bacterium]
MEQNEVLEYFDFLQSLADAAAKITLSHFRQKVHVENKNSQTNKIDPGTIADQKAEEVIRELILKKYPKHTIIGEEFDTIDGNPNYRW